MKVFVLGGHGSSRGALYVASGPGIIVERPVPVFDPANRRFEFEQRLAFDVGLGGRLPVGEIFGIFAEWRSTTYVTSLENRLVAARAPSDSSQWIGDKPLVMMQSLQLGVTIRWPLSGAARPGGAPVAGAW